MQSRRSRCSASATQKGFLPLLATLATSAAALRLGVQNQKPERPPLALSFEATLRSERSTGPGDDTSEKDVRHVAFDKERFSLAMLAHPSTDRANSGGVVVDVLSNIQTQVEPFFDGQVCFAFDLDNRQQGPPSDEDAEMVFKSMADDVFGVPLALYDKADLYQDSVNTSGHTCHVWTSRLNTTISAPSPREFYALAAKLRLSYSVLKDVRFKSKQPRGDLLLQANTSFCVDEFGRLHAANTSQRAVLLGPDGAQSLLRYDIARASLDNVRSLDEQGATLFQPGRNASGGHCVNLTSGNAFHEMHKELNDGHRIARINTEARGGWEAAPYQHWSDFSVKDIVQTLGTSMRPLRLPLKHTSRKCNEGNPLSRKCRFEETVAPPLHFDARKHWSKCDSIRTIRNQGACGSCWAVAAATVLADRICIESLKANMSDAQFNFNKLRLSPQYLLDCDEDGGACNGGHLDDAWEFLQSDGIPEESCDPYAFCMNVSDPQCGVENPQTLFEGADEQERVRKCPANCDGQVVRTFRAQHVYAVSSPGDIPRIQQEIYNHGPVEAAFFVFSDFHSYRRGTYSRTPSAMGPLGGHAVRLVGWGVDKRKKDFWTVANSFGANWGMKGFFRILRGTNECGIETMPAAGLPLLSWQGPKSV